MNLYEFLISGLVWIAVIGFLWVVVVVVNDAKKRMKEKRKKLKEGIMEERIKAIIAEQLGVELRDVTPQVSLSEDLGMDSLDGVELTMSLEEEFNIEVPDEDAEKLLTPGDIVRYIEEKVKGK